MNKILKGTLVLSAAALIIKVIGAFYRVPLTNLLGTDGIGLYQMVFPFYVMLLTVSSSGLPTGISKLVADGADPKKVVYKSIITFSLLGLLGTLVMFFGGEAIAKLQGSPAASAAFKALSPSVFLVSLIAVMRGYFQGKDNMTTTAVSQIIEQVIKCASGLLLVLLFATGPTEGAFFACLAVSLSELFALIYLIVIFIRDDRRTRPSENKTSVRTSGLLITVLPVMAMAAILPLSRMIDSFIVVKSLKVYTDKATSLYGAYTGGVESIVSIFTSVSVGISTSALPTMARGEDGRVGKRVIGLTALFSSACAALTAIFAPLIIGILYSGLSAEDREIMVGLLRVSSLVIWSLPLVQTTSTALVARGRAGLSSCNLILGVLVKLIAVTTLIKNPEINIYAVAFSDILCYFVAAFFNLLYIISEEKQGEAIGPLFLYKRLKKMAAKR